MTQFKTLEGNLCILINIAAVFLKVRAAGWVKLIGTKDTKKDAVFHDMPNLGVHKIGEKTAELLGIQIKL